MKISLISDAMASLIEIQASTLTRCYLNSFVMELPRLLETGSFAVTDRSSDTAISIGLRWRAQGWICISNRSDWNWNISHFVDNGDVFTLWRLDRVVRPTPFHLKCEKKTPLLSTRWVCWALRCHKLRSERSMNINFHFPLVTCIF